MKVPTDLKITVMETFLKRLLKLMLKQRWIKSITNTPINNVNQLIEIGLRNSPIMTLIGIGYNT